MTTMGMLLIAAVANLGSEGKVAIDDFAKAVTHMLVRGPVTKRKTHLVVLIVMIWLICQRKK